MNKIFIISTLFALALLNSKAFAADMEDMFYWSNVKGLVSAKSCKLATITNPKLGFLKAEPSYESVILEKNLGLSNLLVGPGSLVKLGDNSPIPFKIQVEVVGVNGVSPQEIGAIRGDRGDVNQNNLESISKRFIQLKVDYLNALGGTYWKVFGKDKFLKINCPEFAQTDDYIVFSVYPEDGGRALARVGISSSDTELFKNIVTHNKYKIYRKFPEIVIDETSAILEIESLKDSTTTIEDKPVIIPDEEDIPVKEDVPVKEDIPVKDDNKPEDVKVDDEVVVQGLDTIICTDQNYINVRNEELSEVVFTAKNGNRVKIFQGWGDNKIEGTINGKKYDFLKIEFLDNEDDNKKVGFVASTFIQPKSTCVHHPSYRDNLKPADTTFKGLNDKLCCNFPTLKKVTTPFNEGMRRFGASRGGGSRSHAAADLYRFKDEPIFSSAPGVVIRSLYYFYEDTFALEVLNSGGFVIRYGELTGEQVDNASLGKQVKKGDRLGFIGKVSSGCCEPMLHFELYTGKLKGPLTINGSTVNGVLYHRRKDLINPTKYLLKWETAKF